MRTHLNVLALLYLLASIGEVIAAFAIFGILGGAGLLSGDVFAFSFLAGLGSILGFFLLLIGLPGLILAWGFWKLTSWARPLGFVLGVLNLFNAPLGTLLGIYTIWALLQDETTRLLEGVAVGPTA
ncbi:MAG TPA: hypothetical protein VMN78_01605 [Longimicrobiales bacterium]|nr:hypothetical protein [Longimicrobiales bacterium]